MLEPMYWARRYEAALEQERDDARGVEADINAAHREYQKLKSRLRNSLNGARMLDPFSARLGRGQRLFPRAESINFRSLRLPQTLSTS